MYDHEVYAYNLCSDKGFAPWIPGPVDIAEVGYVVHGCWIPLFNASKKPDDETNKLGVPDGYRPLDIGALNTRTLSGVPISNQRGTSSGFEMKVSSAVAVTSTEAQYMFTTSKQEGAILVPGGNINVADTLEKATFIRYILENHASWLEFANTKHNRLIRLIDLVLVTGCHKTTSWACAAFSQCSREANLTFNVGAGIMQGGVWGKWLNITCPGVWAHSGPIMDDELLSSPQMEGAYQQHSADVQALGTGPVRDQGVFIRGFKICDRRTGLARLFHRKQGLEYAEDGFICITLSDYEKGHSIDADRGRDVDRDRDGDPSSRGHDPSGGPSTSSSFPPSSSGSQGGAIGRSSDGNPGPSGSSHRDNLAYSIDDDVELYLQLNGHKEPTAVEVILEYILENSTVEFSLAHDDDVTELLQDGFGAEDFAVEIRKISPRIFVVGKVGMLHQTSLAFMGDQQGNSRASQGTHSTTAYVPHIESSCFPSSSSPTPPSPPSPTSLSPPSPTTSFFSATGNAPFNHVISIPVPDEDAVAHMRSHDLGGSESASIFPGCKSTTVEPTRVNTHLALHLYDDQAYE